MDNIRRGRLTVLFVAVTVLIVALMLSSNFHRTSRISLPSPEASSGTADPGDTPGQVRVAPIEITPETVQPAVATLARPAEYRRTVQLEQFWDGGSGTAEAVTTVFGAWTRVDLTPSKGDARHSLTDGTTTYVWYGDGKTVYSGPAGGIGADQEQMIPTYEDILRLDPKTITAADYRLLGEETCIFAECEEREGTFLRYWVSVGNGLLLAAEREENGNVVYRMTAQPPEEELPAEKDILLPDGSVPGSHEKENEPETN